MNITYDASATLGTETQYLIAGSRIVWQQAIDPPLYDGPHRDLRITFALKNYLGSATAVIDHYSEELLEWTGYYPNGAVETHMSQTAATMQPEPLGFTGKEADDEVGVVYFGERYLIPRIGRWASPDPLHVHAVGGGEALNSYHYVAGNILQARDPLGLDVEVDSSVVTVDTTRGTTKQVTTEQSEANAAFWDTFTATTPAAEQGFFRMDGNRLLLTDEGQRAHQDGREVSHTTREWMEAVTDTSSVFHVVPIDLLSDNGLATRAIAGTLRSTPPPSTTGNAPRGGSFSVLSAGTAPLLSSERRVDFHLSASGDQGAITNGITFPGTWTDAEGRTHYTSAYIHAEAANIDTLVLKVTGVADLRSNRVGLHERSMVAPNHEVLGHALPRSRGQPHLHGPPAVESRVDQIEEMTIEQIIQNGRRPSLPPTP